MVPSGAGKSDFPPSDSESRLRLRVRRGVGDRPCRMVWFHGFRHCRAGRRASGGGRRAVPAAHVTGDPRGPCSSFAVQEGRRRRRRRRTRGPCAGRREPSASRHRGLLVGRARYPCADGEQDAVEAAGGVGGPGGAAEAHGTARSSPPPPPPPPPALPDEPVAAGVLPVRASSTSGPPACGRRALR